MQTSRSQTSSLLTEQTLADQLQISDREIEYRKQLMGFTQKDAEVLISMRGVIQQNLDEIVDEFYLKQKANSEFALLVGDSETFRRLHSSMHRYVQELFEGFYDADYVNKRLRIGKVHQRIGISPKLYLSAIMQLEEILQRYINLGNEQASNCQNCRQAANALHKLLMFDIQFVFDTYIHSLVSEVEATKHKVEEYAHSLEETVAVRTHELERLSRLDPLTELNNQRSFYEHLRSELARAERQLQPVSLLYIDLNHFKQLNDSEGHKRGDEVLQLAGRSMKAASRESDICCRYGGDEFCVLLPDSHHDDAIQYAQRLLTVFDSENQSPVSMSIGIAQTGPDEHVHGDTLIRQADQSMYRAKQQAHQNGSHHIDTTGPNLVSLEGGRSDPPEESTDQAMTADTLTR